MSIFAVLDLWPGLESVRGREKTRRVQLPVWEALFASQAIGKLGNNPQTKQRFSCFRFIMVRAVSSEAVPG
jgi:hypothetical protein